MSAVFIIARQILIMFFYMGIGFFLYKKQLVSKEGSKSMAHLLLYCILPSVIIKSFCIPRTAENTRSFLVSVGLAVVLLALSILVSGVLFRNHPMDNFGCSFSNAGFMGFPLIIAFLGSGAVFYAAAFVALLNVAQWTYGQWILTRDKKMISFSAIFKNPILIAFALGLLIFFTGLPLPGIVTDTMGSLAALNAPIAMIILGVYLAQADLKATFCMPRLYVVSVVRLIIIPTLSLLCLLVAPQEWHTLCLAILLSASAPIGSNVAVYAQKLNLDYTYAVQTVCISTLLSIVSLPLIISLAVSIGL